MTQKKRQIAKGNDITCPNPLCGKTFSNPIKAEMLGSKNSEKYDACPYCLTEIKVEEDTKTFEVQKGKEEIKIGQTEVRKTEKQTAQSLQKTEGCLHYMGYLSQRSTKEKIPEECMVCQNIVQCMLKNVTG